MTTNGEQIGYTTIKNTDLNPSRICLGTGGIGFRNTEEEAFEILDEYLALGGNFIDTARVYSNWIPGELNRSERIIGDWLQVRDRKNREEVIIGTKGGHPDLNTLDIPRLSDGEVRGDLEGSLVSLGVERIDLYWLHRDDPGRPVEEIIEMLQGFVSEGKIRYYGCSNWKAARIKASLDYAKEKGYTGFVANQPLWNLGSFHMKPPEDKTMVVFDQEDYKFHTESGLAIIPYSSQANGFFSKLDSNDSGIRKKAEESSYYTPGNLKIFDSLKKMSQESGVHIGDLALDFLLYQPVMTIPIIFCRNLGQLRESMGAVGKKIPPSFWDEVKGQIPLSV